MEDTGQEPLERREAWSNLWATGVADTFGHSGETGSSEPPLARAWREWFSSLPPGSSVLDLGTGNGALPLLMLQSAPASITCDAVDIANLSPRWLDRYPAEQRARVRFHPGVDCSRLPFSSASFDAVSSQFGAEYAGLAQALDEALRVLRPEGRMRLALHARDGRPVQLAQEELTHGEWLRDSGWWDASHDMVRAMSLVGTPDGLQQLNTQAQWQGVRKRFDELSAELRERARTSSCPDLLLDAHGWIVQAFRTAAAQGWPAAETTLGEVAALLRDGETRLRDLLAHAASDDDIAAAIATIEASGRVARAEPAVDRGHRMGWWLLAA